MESYNQNYNIYKMNKEPYCDKIDMFGTSPETANLNGRKRIHTCPGVCCTFIVILLVLAFMGLRVCEIILEETPLVVAADKIGVWDDATANVDVSKIDFMVAFAVRNLKDGRYKSDKGNVNWEVKIHQSKDSKQIIA